MTKRWNVPSANQNVDEGEEYKHSSQFAGSRAMMRSCHLMLGLEGDKDPDKEEAERNMRRLVILEDRAYGATGYIPLYYDMKTGLYHEMKEA